jgi:hypothetical protein
VTDGPPGWPSGRGGGPSDVFAQFRADFAQELAVLAETRQA